MNGKCSKPGGQGSAGSTPTTTTTTTPTNTTTTTTTTPLGGDTSQPFGWVGSGENGEWSEADYANVQEIIAVEGENGELQSGIEKLLQDGVLKTKVDIKRYLNELMEDGGITLAQYEVLKLVYEIE